MAIPAKRPLLITALLCALASGGGGAEPAMAAGGSPAQTGAPPGPLYIRPSSLTVPPPTFRVSAQRAEALAARTPQVRAAKARYPDLQPEAFIAGAGVWDIDWLTQSRTPAARLVSRQPVEAFVNGRSGALIRVWSGIQSSFPLARGHFGHYADNPWLWAALAVLFVAPFVDPRRPLRALHLDLLVLLSFAVSQAFYTSGDISASVPLVYPVLAYLLVRMLVAGIRPRRRAEPLIPHAPTKLLAGGLFVLVAFRIAFNFVNNKVIDVGYASVEGAYRILHGLPLYVLSIYHGDTYGPVNYVAYTPFEQLFPWTGSWDTLPAAHLAAISFDLLTIVGLYVLGTKLRAGAAGRRLGVGLAFAWSAYPYTVYALALNTNDALISMLLVWALVAIASPTKRSLLVALAGAAKFAPLALAPLFATGRGERRARSIVISMLVSLAVLAVSLAGYWPKGGFHVFWTETIGYQMTRGDVFSLWALHPSLSWLATVLEVAAVLLALAVAFVPRRRDTFQVAALAAAVLIAVQLPVKHWFYFYIVWFAPYVLVALFGQYRTDPRGREAGELESPTIAMPETTAGLETQAA